MLAMATKLLAFMGSKASESDEEYYSGDYVNIDEYRKTFEMVFYAMGQDQHYKMMMSDN